MFLCFYFAVLLICVFFCSVTIFVNVFIFFRRIYAVAKRNARNAAKQKGVDFEESYGPHWDDLGSSRFRKQLQTSRKQISLSLWRW